MAEQFKILQTSKSFFGKWSRRAEIIIPRDQPWPASLGNPATKFSWKLSIDRKFGTDSCKTIVTFRFPGRKYESRSDLIFIYYSKPEITDYLIDNYSDILVSIAEPLNAVAENLILSDITVEVRKSLPKGKYRYVATFGRFWEAPYRREDLTSMIQELESMKPAVEFTQQLKEWNYFTDFRIYVDNADTVLMLRLKFGNTVDKIKKIVLESELIDVPDQLTSESS